MADEHLIVVLHQIDSLNVSNLHNNDIILKQRIHHNKLSMEIASDTPSINEMSLKQTPGEWRMNTLLWS